MKQEILDVLKDVTKGLGIEGNSIKLDYPENFNHGDFTTNIALLSARDLEMSPKVLAEKIVAEFNKKQPKFIREVNIAGVGFINFFIKDEFFAQEIALISDTDFGKSVIEKGKKVMIEYTDPNTFKAFHIGHLMSNAIGESISRLIEYSGASVTRICYPSDIGLHIAKAIWAIQKHQDEVPADGASIIEKTTFLGKMYVEGTVAYEADPANKDDIDALNKVIYEKSSPAVNNLYEKGRQWSLEHFELLYKILGTKFDDTIFESDMAPVGLDMVKTHLKNGIFEESEGAIVFKGEKYGLHTRVFINSKGLPTYEAKDIGLNITKFNKHPDSEQSIIITASEQNDYFKVITKILSLIDEKNGAKTKHIGHGMMRFASGKMSSRTGKVITAEDLLADIRELVAGKIVGRGFSAEETEEISSVIAVGAIKYSILRSSIGGDIIFDSAASISFEGDSGPYLQYSVVRANTVLNKAKQEGIKDFSNKDSKVPEKVSSVERLISRFPDIVERAKDEYVPQLVANYLINLAGTFNSFYASQTIVNKGDPLSPYYVMLTKTFRDTMTKGLWLLGIKVPSKM